METGLTFLEMETAIKENLKRARQMAKVSILGRMARFMLENSKTDSSMEREDGSQRVKSTILTNMKVNMLMTRSMDSVCSSGPVGIFTKVSILKMKDMVLEK